MALILVMTSITTHQLVISSAAWLLLPLCWRRTQGYLRLMPTTWAVKHAVVSNMGLTLLWCTSLRLLMAMAMRVAWWVQISSKRQHEKNYFLCNFLFGLIFLFYYFLTVSEWVIWGNKRKCFIGDRVRANLWQKKKWRSHASQVLRNIINGIYHLWLF